MSGDGFSKVPAQAWPGMTYGQLADTSARDFLNHLTNLHEVGTLAFPTSCEVRHGSAEEVWKAG